MSIKLYNTLSREIEEFKPIKRGLAKVYSCGPTVYNYAHIGNLRSFLCADLLQRVLRVVDGYNVTWVMNITDIDDKTIKSVNDNSAWKPEMGEKTSNIKENLKKFTQYYKEEFLNDIKKLGIEKKHFSEMPCATDYIEQMKDLIIKIGNNGFAYESQGSVYFNVGKWREADKYGKLKNIDFENFRSGERVDSDEYEREQVSDFVLWKAKKENEPSWELDFDGKTLVGRPGWHLECSSMEYEILGLPFDIHTGGVDLQFPHHEDEIAQSKAGYGVEPTNYWFHNEFLQVEGAKMSKSAGNFFTLRDLTQKGLDPIDIRFAMLSAHYRSKYNFTFADVEAAGKSRKRIQRYVFDLINNSDGHEYIDVTSFSKQFFKNLQNDLHTPKALGELFTFINNNSPYVVGKNSRMELLEFFEEFNEIFGILTFTVPDEDIPEEVVTLANKRLEAKKNKNFDLSDMLRIEIQNRGFLVKDTVDGYEIEKL
ncbi:cysteine--tRNA ligase [bacterium]|nr:MAG: cysteine--tRNA ligase [bacterium]